MLTLLANSMEKDDHGIAAREWAFTGEVIDHLVPNQTCQLCGAGHLRYHFRISNRSRRDVSLLVGSSCIRNFDIPVLNGSGQKLSGKRRSSFLRQRGAQKRQGHRRRYPLPSPERAGKDAKVFHLPEYVTCSICGEYTKEWVSFNPNKCRRCLDKQYEKR